MKIFLFQLFNRKQKTAVKFWIKKAHIIGNQLLSIIFLKTALGHLLVRICGDQMRCYLGRIEYLTSLTGATCNSISEIRRDIHRIEKGLIMKNRRANFGQRYLNSLCNNITNVKENNDWNHLEIKWVVDVLDTYFDTVVFDSEIESCFRKIKPVLLELKQKIQFSDLNQIHAAESKFKPYTRSKAVDYGIIHDMKELFIRRRSVRDFDESLIDAGLVQEIINEAATMPSACNRQPYRFIYLTDRKLSQKMLRLSAGTSGWIENIPSSIVVVGDFAKLNEKRDKNLIFIDSSLAVGGLLISAEAKGVSTCTINWKDDESSHRAAMELLGLKLTERVIMQIAIGVASERHMVPFSQKKIDDQILEVR